MSTSADADMAPEASPGDQSGRSGVRRVNNLPIYIVAGALGVFLLIMALVAWDRAANQHQGAKPADDLRKGNTKMFAEEIAGSQKDGMVQPKAPAPPTLPVEPAPGAILVARPDNLDLPPLPPGSQGQSGNAGPTPRDEEAMRFRMMKMQQFDEAVRAKTGLAVIAPRSAASGPLAPGGTGTGTGTGTGPGIGTIAGADTMLARLASVRQQIEESTRDDPAAAYAARLRQIQGGGAADGQSPGGSETSAAPGRRNDIAQFAGSAREDRWRLDSGVEAPRSPYELRAGFVVPATLISGINSELPGQIVAQVSQDVYDTPIGKYKLIPQGSRLVGSYASDVAYGQSRILIAWQRIVFPDGKALDIGATPGVDGAGYGGFKDQVNNHYFRVFSSAFLMSGVTAGVALSQPQTGNANARPTAGSALSEAMGQQLGQATAQMIAKNLNIAPTLEIRPGYRFNVIVIKDLTFSKPYKPFDY